jgi:hypothetical protein
MREHPIPQDISAYRFHIIGNMTIKQFAEVGAGCVVGFLIYATNLPNLIKWPLIGLAVAAGVMMAFVPIEERPLDHWLITFLRILYKPTQFFWKREPKIPDPFLYKPVEDVSTQSIQVDLTPARRQRIKEYMHSLHDLTPDTNFDPQEEARLQIIMASFQYGDVGQGKAGTMKPSLSVRVRSLKGHTSDEMYSATADTWANTEDQVLEMNLVSQNTSSIQPRLMVADKPVLDVEAVAQEISIPEVTEIKIETQTQPSPANPPAPTEETLSTVATFVDTTQELVPVTATPIQADLALLNKNLPFPVRPSEPNKLVGMLLSANHDILENAIIEIQNSEGRVVRAVKANALGQFFVTTPLEDGVYTLHAEKDTYTFVPQQITLAQQIVDPIEIRSTN